MREVIKTAPDVDQAISLACEELGVSTEDAIVEVLELPSKRLFGLLGNTPAKVKVSIEEPERAVKPEPVKPAAPQRAQQAQPKGDTKAAAPAPEKREKGGEPAAPTEAALEKADGAKVYLESILKGMGMESATVEGRVVDGSYRFEVLGEGLGALIGRRGETLDAIQYLVGLACNRGGGDYLKITVDCSGYRDKRKQTLQALAQKVAGTAAKTGRSTTLEPMNPYERRIIHSAVAEVEGATSASVGEDPYRKVVIKSTNPRARRDSRDSRDNRGPRSGGGYNRDRRAGDRGDRRPPRARDMGPKPDQTPAKNPKNEAEDQPLYGKIEL